MATSETEKRGYEAVSGGHPDTHPNVKRKRYNDTRFRLLFHQESVGRVIGKNGENLKSARHDCSAKAHLRVPEFPHYSNNKDRILMVSCELTDVSTLIHRLSPSIWHMYHEGPQREFNLLIPSDVAGAVLGKGGSTLKDLRDQYGCKVKMNKDKLPYSDERVLEIAGSEDKIDAMIDTIIAVLKILQDKPLDHDYIRYTPYVCQEEDYRGIQCGGYNKLGGDGGGGKLTMTIRSDGQLSGNRPGNRSDPIDRNYSAPLHNDRNYSNYSNTSSSMDLSYQKPMEYSYSSLPQTQPSSYTHFNITDNTSQFTQSYPSGAPQDHSTPRHGGYTSDPGPRPRSPPPRGYSPPPPRGYSPPPPRRSPPRPRSPPRREDYGRRPASNRSRSPDRGIVDDFMMEEITKDITIDDALTSSIIGPKGATIKAVRMNTSAMIKIGDDVTVVDGTRKIVITGTMKEVMWAFSKIKTLILDAESALRGRGRGDSDTRPYEQQNHPPAELRHASNSKLFMLAQDLLPFTPSTDESHEKTEKSIAIPNQNAGRVLGRKASIINEIRNISNCKINVEKDGEVVGEDRRITIAGTPRDIHLAEYMIEAAQQMPRDAPQICGLIPFNNR